MSDVGDLKSTLSDAESEWIEVVIGSSVALADGVAAELVQAVEAARHGVQVRKGDVVFWVHPGELETTLETVRDHLRALARQGWQLDPERVRAGALAPEEEWRDAWKKYFHVTSLTRQIVVVPSWESFEPAADDIPIHLDPGQAFGTGAHASTQLLLEELQELVDGEAFPTPETVFDLGTGSGILAIAAAKFWPATQIVATDIDPLSVSATEENAKKNGVHSQINVSTTPLAAIDARFPLVLANMQAHILRELREELVPRVGPEGSLLVSGILNSQIQSLSSYFCECDQLELVSIRRSRLNPDWSSAHLRRL